jgi:hypothetical protein
LLLPCNPVCHGAGKSRREPEDNLTHSNEQWRGCLHSQTIQHGPAGVAAMVAVVSPGVMVSVGFHRRFGLSAYDPPHDFGARLRISSSRSGVEGHVWAIAGTGSVCEFVFARGNLVRRTALLSPCQQRLRQLCHDAGAR